MATKFEAPDREETIVDTIPELIEWVQNQVAAGTGTREELVRMIVDGFDRWERSGIDVANCRSIALQLGQSSLTIIADADFAEVRNEAAALSFSLIARGSRQQQVQAVAELLRRAAEVDKPTQNLRGAITELEK